MILLLESSFLEEYIILDNKFLLPKLPEMYIGRKNENIDSG